MSCFEKKNDCNNFKISSEIIFDRNEQINALELTINK